MTLDKTVPAGQINEAYKGELKRGTALRRPCVVFVAAAMAGMVLSAAPVHAQSIDPSTTPTGGVVTGGNATISYPSSNQLEVNQTSNRAFIDWNTFDIGANASAEFFQPSSSAIAVNRVNGSVNPTQILGSLSANGNIIILDPNGVFFGANARVDVGGIVASTGDIDPTAFMAGGQIQITNVDTGGSVINQGQITAAEGGLVGFVAPQVLNSGYIRANLGTVQMSSGAAATLDFYGDGLVEIAVTGQVADAMAENSGDIVARGGHVIMTAEAASNVVGNVINMSGTIDASGFSVNDAGDIILDGGDNGITELSGTITNIGDTGGTVTVTGHNVYLTETSKINASGSSQGGTVYIGGESQGSGTTRQAANTYVADGADIRVNNRDQGDGGTAIVWATGSTVFYGSIDARGGRNGGNGGFVETSGLDRLVVMGNASADVSARNGEAGQWLLDPRTLIITTFSSDVTPETPFEPDSGGLRRPSYLDVNILLAALNTGSSVTVSTVGSPEGILDGDGDIIFNATIAKTGGTDATLTVLAASDIMFQSGSNGIYSTSGALNVVFDAQGGIIMSDKDISTNGGFVDFTAQTRIDIANAINTAGGDVYLHTDEGVNVTGTLDAGAGSVLFSRLAGPGVISLGDDNGGYYASQASLDNMTAATLLVGDSANADDTGAIVSNADLTGFGNVQFNTGDVSFSGVNSFNDLTVATAGSSTVDGTLSGGAVSFDVAQFTLNGAMSAASADITSADDVTIAGSLTTTGNVTLSAGTVVNGDDMASSSVVDISGSVTTNGGDFTSNGGMFNVTGTVDSGAGALTINNTGLWQAAAGSLNTGGDLSLAVSTVTGGQGFREVLGGNSGLSEALAAGSGAGGMLSISADAGDYNGGVGISRDNVTMSGDSSLVHVASGGTGFDVTGNDVAISGFSFTGDGTGTGVAATGVSGLSLTGGFDSLGTGVALDGVSASTIDGASITNNGTGVDIANGSDITISNTTLDGNGTAVRATDTDMLFITDNMFFNSAQSLDFANVSNLEFTGNNISLKPDYGFVISGVSEAVIENNTIDGYGVAGILIENAEDTTVANNIITGNPIGVWVTNSSGTQIRDNTFIDNDVAIRVDDSHNTHIQNNSFSGGTDGVVANGGSNLHVFDNDFDGLSGDAVNVEDYFHVQVQSNDFHDVAGGAASFGSVWFVSVMDNDIENVGGDGIAINGSLHATVQNNDISGFGGSAIAMDNVLFAGVRNNEIHDTGYVAPVVPEPEPEPVVVEPDPVDDGGEAENDDDGGSAVDIDNVGFINISGNDIDGGDDEDENDTGISVSDSFIARISNNNIVNTTTGVSATSNGFVGISGNDIDVSGDAIVTEGNGFVAEYNNSTGDDDSANGGGDGDGDGKKRKKRGWFGFWR